MVVPSGVISIGGVLSEDDRYRRRIIGDPIGYKAFWCDDLVREAFLPDSTEAIGFKFFEHCSELEVLSFSNNVKAIECNDLLGCRKLKKIIFRGTVFKISNIYLDRDLDLDVV